MAEQLERIKTIVDLTRCKVDILKLKADDYIWACHVDDKTKEMLEATLVEIDSMLELLSTKEVSHE